MRCTPVPTICNTPVNRSAKTSSCPRARAQASLFEIPFSGRPPARPFLFCFYFPLPGFYGDFAAGSVYWGAKGGLGCEPAGRDGGVADLAMVSLMAACMGGVLLLMGYMGRS